VTTGANARELGLLGDDGVKLMELDTEERGAEGDGVEKSDDERVRGRMPAEAELRGLGVAAGVGRSPTRERRRRVNDAGRPLCGGVGLVTWVVGIPILALESFPVTSSSSSSSSTSVCSSTLLGIEVCARLLPKLSRFPTTEVAPRPKFASEAEWADMMQPKCEVPAVMRLISEVN